MLLNFFLMAVYVAAVQSSNARDRIYYEEKFFNWLSFFKIEPPTGSSGNILMSGGNFKFQSNYLNYFQLTRDAFCALATELRQ